MRLQCIVVKIIVYLQGLFVLVSDIDRFVFVSFLSHLLSDLKV